MNRTATTTTATGTAATSLSALVAAVLAVLAVLGVVAVSAASGAHAATGTTRTGTAAVGTALGSQVAVGAWVDGMDAAPSMLDSYDTSIGRATSIASVFRGYGEYFPAAADIALTGAGKRTLLVAWYLDNDRYTGYTSGAHDAYLAKEAATIKAYPGTVYIRPWAEMNGDWQAFQPTATGTKQYGGTPAQFIAAWRHVVDLFRANGATNARWVFNPTTDTYTGTTDVRTIFPGTSYVDVLGLDGYNWGTGNGLAWRTFADIYTTQYTRLTTLDPTAPVWVCEFGSKEPTLNDGAPIDPTHTKATWYHDMLTSTAFPKITALVAFQAKKERDWRAGSTTTALAAYKTGIAPGAGTTIH